MTALLEPIGALSCKVPASVDLPAVMTKLTGTLGGLTPQQLTKLPALVKVTIGVKPATLEPFFSLSASQLQKVLPVLTDVKADTLEAVFPLLAEQPAGTMDKMIRFLKGTSLAKLEQLSPLFSRITEGQLNVMMKAMDVLPEHAWGMLINMVQGLGPVVDSVVTVKQAKGLLPISTGSSSSASSSSSAGSSSTGSSLTSGIVVGPGTGLVIGRKMLQGSKGCSIDEKGAEIAIPLSTDPTFGKVACKFTADKLQPVMLNVLGILNKQSKQTLANLPAFTDRLTSLDPKAMAAVLQIPTDTMAALIPVMDSLNPKEVSAQLKALGSVDKATIGNMVYFMQNTPNTQIKLLMPMFGRMSDRDVDTMVKFMNALSPGQITLSLHLLNTFGFAVDAIGRSMPQSSRRAPGSTFMIGPVRVTLGSRSSTGGIQFPAPFVIG